MTTWIEDRATLRELLRGETEGGRPQGLLGTFLCVLVSHLRGRLHMRSYNSKAGGWRLFGGPKQEKAPAPFQKMYGEMAQVYYEGSVITSLEDQEAWIKKYLMAVTVSDTTPIGKLTKRVLEKSWGEGEEDGAAEVLHSADPQGEGQRLRGLFSRLSGLCNRRKNAGGS